MTTGAAEVPSGEALEEETLSAGWLVEVRAARRALRDRRVDRAFLACLYAEYNPIPDVALFVARALDLFPRSCCGLASVYLRSRLGVGTVTRGSYRQEPHTFLTIGTFVVDVTADQFGGPGVYLGPLTDPWAISSDAREGPCDPRGCLSAYHSKRGLPTQRCARGTRVEATSAEQEKP